MTLFVDEDHAVVECAFGDDAGDEALVNWRPSRVGCPA
jgi:hypothetical protein